MWKNAASVDPCKKVSLSTHVQLLRLQIKRTKTETFFHFFCLKVYSSPTSTELNTIFIDQHKKKEYYVNVE